MKIGRETLYAGVWSSPMTVVAVKYGVSSSFLARICESLKVPHPPRGYWAQLKVGKAPPRPDLPSPQPGDALEWSRDGVPPKRIPAALPHAPRSRPPPRPQKERPARHPLVVGVRDLFLKTRDSGYFGAGYLRPFKRKLVDVFVSPGSMDAALEAASGLFLGLEDRGYSVTLAERGEPRLFHASLGGDDAPPSRKAFRWDSWAPSNPTVVHIGTVAIGLTLYEIAEETDVVRVDSKYVRVSDLPRRGGRSRQLGYVSKHDMPTGRFAVRAYSPYRETSWEQEWKEGTRGELASRVSEIADALEKAAPHIARLVAAAEKEAEERRRRWEAQQREWAKEAQERRRQEAFKQSRDELLAAIDSWAFVSRVEAFFADAEKRAQALGASDAAQISDRVRLARGLIGDLDSLAKLRRWRTPAERLTSESTL